CNGQFYANKDNYIVNAQGQRLTGYGVNGTDLVPIMVPVGNIAPRATDGLTTKTNLDANAPVIHPTSTAQQTGIIRLSTDGGTTFADYEYTVNSDGDAVWSAPGLVDGTDYEMLDGNSFTYQATTPIAASTLPAPDTSEGEQAFVAAIVGHPFDPNDAQSFTHSLPISVYDSLGNAHQLTQYFVKR